MASTYSPSLRLELIGDGDQSGTWGQTTNNNLGALIEQAVSGVISIAMTDANYTLSNFNGVVDEARNQVLVFTGALTATRNVIAPLVEKTYVIKNSTSGGQSIQIIGSSGLGITIPNGVTIPVYCDGTNFNTANNGVVGNLSITGNLTVSGSATLGTPLAVSSGGTGVATVTNHYVPYGNGTSPLQTSPQFQYNGSYLLVGSSAALGGATNPVIAMTGSANGYIQSYIYNSQNNTSSSADFAAYPSNGSDASGYVDMGITSLAYNDPVFPIFQSNEGYLIMSAPSGSGTSGNLVYATDSTGTQNYHQWYVGNFAAAKSAWKMQLTSTGLTVAGVSTATSFTGAGTGLTGTASALSIGGNAATATTATSATTVTTTVASGATGTTQTAGDNSTKIATTAYVATAVSGGIGGLGTMATQNANAVAITGGTISGLSSLGVSGTATATTFSGAGTSLTGTAASLSIGGTAAGLSATLAVASGGTGVTTSTGTGSVVLNTSPTLVTPALGTPSSGNLANCTFPTLNQNTTGTAGGLTGTPNITVGTVSASTIGGTTITASTQFSGPGTGLTGTASGLSIGGNAATATNATNASSVPYSGLTGAVPTWNQNTTGTAAGLSATLAVASGGTGITSAGTSGNVLTSNGSAFVSSANPFTGANSQIFTSSGTFTIPAGITAIKVTVVGGGGGGAGGATNPTDSTAGGASSVASGTQSITTISGGGGGNARANAQSGSYFGGAGGTASGGDINITGVAGTGVFRVSPGGGGCCCAPAGWSAPSTFNATQAALGLQQKNYYIGIYGSNGIASTNSNNGNNGGQGACAIKYLTGLTPSNTLSVTVGAAGTAGNSGGSSGSNTAGGAGIVVFEW
jgi:hypothetical protein